MIERTIYISLFYLFIYLYIYLVDLIYNKILLQN
jgi:hypothetical protein